MGERAADTIEAVFHEEWGRLLATLVRWFGDFDLAEEVAADALATAVERWPAEGVPATPTAWLLTTARRRAIDLLRRRQTFAAKLALLKVEAEQVVAGPGDGESGEGGLIEDDQLRLFFTCCHPALAFEAQVALTLRYLAGLSTAEVARAFLVPEATMAQRLTRAKRKIRAAQIPYRVPAPAELPTRLPAVLSVIYVVFTEAYVASQGPDLVRPALADESIRLARILQRLMPDEHDVTGLLALLLLTDARRAARTDRAGGLVLLADQDRSRWDQPKINEGLALVDRALVGGSPGPYALQAAIAALHDQAGSYDATDWVQIAALYGVLRDVAPSPVVELNRGVAIGMAEGPEAGLRVLDRLQADASLDRSHVFHAARGHFLALRGRVDEAMQEYRAALGLVTNGAERAFLQRRLRDLEPHPYPPLHGVQ